MHAIKAAIQVAPPHVHRRPRSMKSAVWRVVRSILAVLGALFIVFMVLGLTLGRSTPAAKVRPAPAVTVTVRVPGPRVTVTVTPKPAVSIWANHAVVNVNNTPAAGG